MDNSILKQKVRELTSRGGIRNVVWKPEPGDYIIRIVPYKFNRDWPFVEMWFHYNIADKTLLSPHTFGRPDPIMEFAKSLMGTDDEDQKKLGKTLMPKRRIYAPVLVRGSELEGVKFWSFGVKVYEQIVLLMDDPDFGDITDPMDGHDIKITIPKKQANSFAAPSVLVRPKSTPITDNQKVLDLLGEMVDISKQWVEPSYDELKAILANFADEQDAASTTESPKKAGKTVVGDDDDDFVQVKKPVTTGQKASAKAAEASDDDDDPDTGEQSDEQDAPPPVDVRESFKKYFKK